MAPPFHNNVGLSLKNSGNVMLCDSLEEEASNKEAASEDATTDSPKKRKRVTKPNIAKSSVFGSESSTRTFSIPVKLAPRCLTGEIESSLRNLAVVVSERAVWASRLGNFVVEHFPSEFATAFQQSNGQTFYGQLLSALAKGDPVKWSGSVLLLKHLTAFHAMFPTFHATCPKLAGSGVPLIVQEPTRNQMAKDAVKHLKERMHDKLPLFIRHTLRKHLCENSVSLADHLCSGESKRLVYAAARAIMVSACTHGSNTDSIPTAVQAQLERIKTSRNVAREMDEPPLTHISEILPSHVISQLSTVCHTVHAQVRSMLEPLTRAGDELKQIAQERARVKKQQKEEANPNKKPKQDKHTKVIRKQKPPLPNAMWVWCTSDVKYLGMVLPVLKCIRDAFVADAEPRNQILREAQGKQNRATRKSRLDALQPWQREVPDSFDLLPQKPRAVNFVSVSRTVASAVFKKQLAGTTGDPFWWKRILKLDDDRDHVWKGIVDADPFLDRNDLIRLVQKDSRFVPTREFRRNRVGRGNSGHARNRRAKPSRIPSLATSPTHLEALNRLQIPPLIVGGFKTNGYELHLEVMTCDNSQAELCRNRIEGFDYLQNKGFDSLRGESDDGERTPGEHSKGSRWNRVTQRGVYGSVCKQTDANSPTGESRFCVVDPGQINPLTMRAFSIKNGMECMSHDDAQFIVTEAEYHHEVGSSDNKLWEQAIRNQPELKVAAESMSSPVTTADERDHRICTEARYWKVLWTERTNLKYDRNRMQRRCCRDAYTVSVYKWIRDQGCTAVWFGTGSCKARGHRPVPTKSMMRGLGRYIPVVAGDEWGTSSRCPSCKDGTKLKRESNRDKSETPTHSSEVGGTSVPVEDMLATQPESQSKHLPSSPLPIPRMSQQHTSEHRCEICIKCNKKWGHDEVATINQKMRFASLLMGKPDPKWLARNSASIGHASQRKSAITLAP